MLRRAAPAVLAALLALAAVTATGCGDDSEFAGAPVVLISIDTLRSDRLPAYGYGKVATPALDALRADSILYERAYSHTPLTLPSHATMLSGRLPGDHGVRNNSGYVFDGSKVPTVPALLKTAGYDTAAMVSSFVLRRESGLGALFDTFDQPADDADRDQRPGEATLAPTLAWLRQRGEKPFFLFFHLYDPHTPYEPPEPFASRYADRYDGEVASADAAVGKLLDELRRLGIYDRAIVVLTSDHGEGLGEHGEQEHGFFLYRETLQVPLFLKLPGNLRGGTTVKAPAQLLDLAPTLLGLTGIEPPEGLPGASLLALDEPDAAERQIYSETFFPRLHYGWSELVALIAGRHHYIHGAAPELFDVVADPAETNNLLARERRTASDLRRALAEYERDLAPPGEVDADTARRLEALGYAARTVRTKDGALPDPRTKRHVLADMQAAEAAVAATRYDEAATLLRRVIADTPEMVDGWVFLAKVLDLDDDDEGSLAAYRRALELSPGSADIALAAGRQLLQLGRYDEARAHAEIGMSADAAAARGLLASVALARRDAPTALALLRQGAEVSETFRRDLGLALSEAGRGAEALEVLQPIAGGGLEPGTANALAIALSEAGRQEEAAAVVRRVLASQPENARAHEILGMVALRQQRAAEARGHLERALAINRRLPDAWNTLGVALYQLEGPAPALDAWKQAVALDPKRYETIYNIGLVSAQTGQLAQARSALRRVVAEAPPERFADEIARSRQVLAEIGG